MSNETLISFARWEFTIFVGAFAVIILFKLLTGGINTRHLLYGKRQDGTRFFSPERVQLLVATIAIAGQYLLKSSQAESGKMATLPSGSLELLGLSNAVYLGSKAWTMFKKVTAEEEK